MEHVEIKVAGLRCDKCSAFVEGELKKLHGTDNVSVSYPLMQAVLDYDPAVTNMDEIHATITNEEKGFSVA
jgi:Cation transport ATPase